MSAVTDRLALTAPAPTGAAPSGGDWAALMALAAECLAMDGGLPLSADLGFLRRRWSGDGVRTITVRAGDGRLIVAGAVRSGSDGMVFTGLVAPGHRGRGWGSALLDWGLTEATAGTVPTTAGTCGTVAPADASSAPAAVPAPFASFTVPAVSAPAAVPTPASASVPAAASGSFAGVTVETESLTADSAVLFASRGLRQVFAEDVMSIDLTAGVPDPGWPRGTTLREWDTDSAPQFFAAYEASFRERPGFPGLPAGEWIADVQDDDEFRPGWSVLASVPGVGDAGFVTAALGWIVQVGVVPAARGRGLGAALVREALRRMRAAGQTEAWLDVNVDNGAKRLYRQLGFVDRGRRARFRR